MDDQNTRIIERLLASPDPCIRYKISTRVLGEKPDSERAIPLAKKVLISERTQKMLSLRGRDGRFPGSPYAKYTGAHWVLTVLADMAYPPGDTSLLPMRNQVYEKWLAPAHCAERIVEKEAPRYKSRPGVPVIQGRPRRCASQEGNALWATLALGIADERAEQLAQNLLRWQWPDGGWNCDRKAEAINSSFLESLAPLRALFLYGRVHDNRKCIAAAERAAEIFLKRNLFKKQSDGSVIKEDFIKLHYPCFYQYDVLQSLKVMAETGHIGDPRCQDALDLLESKRLPDGGFPAERKHYRANDEPIHGGTLVDWGGTSRKTSNDFVTVDALYVLSASGRI